VSSAVSIRHAARDDIATAVTLLTAQLHEHDIASDERALRAVVEAVIADARHGFMLLAERDGLVVAIAYVAAHLSAEHGGIVGWLEELYVVPVQRGRGVGSALISKIGTTVQKLAWRALELEVVAGHERAVPLYERHGFRALTRSRYTKLIAASPEAARHG
jgi:GNAT superfamily N-acetyltransferase